MSQTTRTERGWAGHFIGADQCRFRRNTLIECGDIRIVVSTVGLMADYKSRGGIMEIGCDRYYETMAFHAKRVEDRYWDADVTQEVSFTSPWSISEIDADDRANDMHEVVVAEIETGLSCGATYRTKEAESVEEQHQ